MEVIVHICWINNLTNMNLEERVIMNMTTKKYIPLFFVLLIISIMLNGWPAGIYPDGSIGIVQILASIGWFAFLMGSILILKNTSLIRFLFNYLRFGFIGGKEGFLIKMFEN